MSAKCMASGTWVVNQIIQLLISLYSIMLFTLQQCLELIEMFRVTTLIISLKKVAP